MSTLRSGLTYANVMATVAVFIALGGGAYAALKLPKNSVGAKQLKKNAVRSGKVKNRTLLAADFKRGQLPKGAAGKPGPPGPTASASDSKNLASDPALSKTTETTYLQTTITTTFQGRIIATGTADLYTSSTTAGGQAACRLFIDAQPVSQRSPADFNTAGGEDEETAATAAATRAAGTHVVSLRCKDEGGMSSPDVHFDAGDLAVLAVRA
jgi:hypothetical protein